MKIRVMGTESECKSFAKFARESIPSENLRSISSYYPNRRTGEYSNEGRIYIEVVMPERKSVHFDKTPID